MIRLISAVFSNGAAELSQKLTGGGEGREANLAIQQIAGGGLPTVAQARCVRSTYALRATVDTLRAR